MAITKSKHIACVMLLVLLLTMAFSVFAFADETSNSETGSTNLTPEMAIEQGIGQASQKAYNIVKIASIAIAVVFIAYNAFKAIMGGEKGMENAKRNMYFIAVSLGIIVLAPMVVQEIVQLFEGMGSGAMNSVFHP